MRKAMLLAVVGTFAISGVASAVKWKRGTYTQGPQTGFTAPGISIDIKAHKFSVNRVLVAETCEYPGQPSIHDFTGFQKGPRATLSGKIKKSGKFAGHFTAGGTTVSVSGKIKHNKLTVHASSSGTYNPPGGPPYDCNGSGTFTPTRS